MKSNSRIAVENINHPGQIRHVDGVRYEAMKRAILKIVPSRSPGLTVAEIQSAVLAHLPQELFPAGTRSGSHAAGPPARGPGHGTGEVPHDPAPPAPESPPVAFTAAFRAAFKQPGCLTTVA
jgi:hypothetical protein